jgi:hypothetical protein
LQQRQQQQQQQQQLGGVAAFTAASSSSSSSSSSGVGTGAGTGAGATTAAAAAAAVKAKRALAFLDDDDEQGEEEDVFHPLQIDSPIIPDTFPKLASLTREQLQRLLSDEVAFEHFRDTNYSGHENQKAMIRVMLNDNVLKARENKLMEEEKEKEKEKEDQVQIGGSGSSSSSGGGLAFQRRKIKALQQELQTLCEVYEKQVTLLNEDVTSTDEVLQALEEKVRLALKRNCCHVMLCACPALPCPACPSLTVCHICFALIDLF